MAIMNIVYAMVLTGFICMTMIMDAEILILFCFVLFVGLAYNAISSTVENTIETEKTKIEKELSNLYFLRNEILKNFILYHKIRISLVDEIKSLLVVSKKEVKNIIVAKKAILDNTLLSQTEAKLNFLLSKDASLVSLTQKESAATFKSTVLSVFSNENKSKKSLQDQILLENISILENKN